MKNLFKLISVLLIICFQNCMSQNTKKYVEQYNEVVPKLQKVANQKATNKSVDQDFESLISSLEKNGVKIIDYGYDGKFANSKEIYLIRLVLIDHKLTDVPNIKNRFQYPVIWITFKERIPDEIRSLTKKYYGELTPEVRKFLGKRVIEKVEFFGINGLTSSDRSAR